MTFQLCIKVMVVTADVGIKIPLGKHYITVHLR